MSEAAKWRMWLSRLLGYGVYVPWAALKYRAFVRETGFAADTNFVAVIVFGGLIVFGLPALFILEMDKVDKPTG